jgi:hypothetical protein
MICGRQFNFGVALATAAVTVPALAHASGTYVGVAQANPKVTGVPVPNVLTPELMESAVVKGATRLENPTTDIPFYGYAGNGPLVPAPSAVQMPGSVIEATKTEPDKNTYLILPGQVGADSIYNYGTHFVFQGHENGITDPVTNAKVGYVTRVNLDADNAHRVTLFATHDVNGVKLPVFDGSTFDPFCRQLLFTAENGAAGGVWQSTFSYPPTVVDISGYLGRGGYEGIQNDADGNVYIVEDAGGSGGPTTSHAKQPNSFVFRYVPTDVTNLTVGGRLQALQVISLAHPGQPIVFHAGQADADILSQDVADLHTYGLTFATHWVTVHDTAIDGTQPFNANAAAKLAQATPFKRPENGAFRPGTDFAELYFSETGDTSATSEANAGFGGYGGIFVWRKTTGSTLADGTLSLVLRGDIDHTAFDNVAFWSANDLAIVEDRGDSLHGQHNALDSAFLIDVTADYGNQATPPPIRFLAQGRDSAATIDSALSAAGNGFQNDGDNEITGIHVSDGDARRRGILGAKIPTPFSNGWRVYYTQQHGDNSLFEILPAPH